jgi:periplasmic protein TonB
VFHVYDDAATKQSFRRFAGSSAAAILVFGALVGLALLFPGRVAEAVQRAKVNVVFRKLPEVKPAPPPPPPPPVVKQVRPKPAPAVVAAVAAPPPAPLEAPKEVPLERPPEADAANAVAGATLAVGGSGPLRAGGQVGGSIEGGGRGPINLPEEAEPPAPDPSNLTPSFPAEARATGAEGLVILKIVVETDGAVRVVKVMRGEEPFVAAALSAVRTWRFRPARVSGEPIAVFKVVKIPFLIKS